VALVGAPNVGKSSLLNALIGEHLALVSAKAQATRMPVVGVRTEGAVQLVFHDTPGLLDPRYLLQTRMRAAALAELRRADIIVQLHPLAEAPAPPLATLVPEITLPAVPLLVAYTKSDLVPPASRDEFPSRSFAISATTGQGLPALLGELALLAPVRPFEVDADELGTQPMRFFVVEYLREAAFEQLADEVPYSFTAEVEELPDGSAHDPREMDVLTRSVMSRFDQYVKLNKKRFWAPVSTSIAGSRCSPSGAVIP